MGLFGNNQKIDIEASLTRILLSGDSDMLIEAITVIQNALGNVCVTVFNSKKQIVGTTEPNSDFKDFIQKELLYLYVDSKGIIHRNNYKERSDVTDSIIGSLMYGNIFTGGVLIECFGEHFPIKNLEKPLEYLTVINYICITNQFIENKSKLDSLSGFLTRDCLLHDLEIRCAKGTIVFISLANLDELNKKKGIPYTDSLIKQFSEKLALSLKDTQLYRVSGRNIAFVHKEKDIYDVRQATLDMLTSFDKDFVELKTRAAITEYETDYFMALYRLESSLKDESLRGNRIIIVREYPYNDTPHTTSSPVYFQSIDGDNSENYKILSDDEVGELAREEEIYEESVTTENEAEFEEIIEGEE